MRVNTAQVRAGEHVGSLGRIVLGQAEMQKNARAEFAQHFDGKYMGLHVGHVRPLVLFRNSRAFTLAARALGFLRQKEPTASPPRMPPPSAPRARQVIHSAARRRPPKTRFPRRRNARTKWQTQTRWRGIRGDTAPPATRD